MRRLRSPPFAVSMTFVVAIIVASLALTWLVPATPEAARLPLIALFGIAIAALVALVGYRAIFRRPNTPPGP